MSSLIEILKKVNVDSPNIFYEWVDKQIILNKKQFIVTANPEIIMLGKKNSEMEKVMQKAIIIPDGIGVVKALKILKKKAFRNTGIELVNHLLEYANKNSLKVFVYGAKEGVLLDFKKNCKKKWSNIQFVGLYNGYDYNKEFVSEEIKKTDSDIIFVALGTPSQELFINSFYNDLNKGICVGIGGSIDVLSGHVQRAPKWFINHNLEWLYRITSEPKRLKRFWNGNVCFVFELLGERLRVFRGI